MLTGLLAALGAGLLWGLVFLTPLVLEDYPGLALAVGRYLAFGVLALGLALFDQRALRRLERADWIEAFKLALIGNLLYYTTLASALQLAGAPLPTLIIGTLPVVIAVCANLLDRQQQASSAVAWRRLLLPLLLIGGGLLIVHGDHARSFPDDNPADFASGLVLAVIALACWTWYPIRNSRWLRARPPGLARAWATAQGLATLPLAAAVGLGWALIDLTWTGDTPASFAWPLGPRPALFVGLCVLLGLAASWLGTILWNKASQLLPAALLGQLIVFETLAALLYAFIWYQRPPSLGEAAGMILLVAGVSFGVRVFRLRH